jgi:alginate O-acetyltransferase complex protein AlgI
VLWGLYQGLLLIVYRPFEPRFASLGQRHGATLQRLTAWLVMFHLTCFGWLIFRAPSLAALRDLTASLFTRFAPRSADVTGLLLPLVLYTTPLILVHLREAWSDDVLVVPRLRPALRYTIYVATMYLIFLFGNFGGSDFIYFQF